MTIDSGLMFKIVVCNPAPFNSTRGALAWARENGVIGRMSSDETGGKGVVNISADSIRESLNPRQREKSVSDPIHFAAITVLLHCLRRDDDSRGCVSGSFDLEKVCPDRYEQGLCLQGKRNRGPSRNVGRQAEACYEPHWEYLDLCDYSTTRRCGCQWIDRLQPISGVSVRPHKTLLTLLVLSPDARLRIT